MARLYTNENFPLKVTLSLRALGHDVLTSQETGKANQAIPDAEVLRFAAEMGRAILTINKRDFVRSGTRIADRPARPRESSSPLVCYSTQRV